MSKRNYHRRAFTLIEMLVVIGIILVIIGALLPALVSAWRNARRTRGAHELQVIAGALEDYRHEFQDYPRIDYTDATLIATPNPGAIVLCWALVAPGSLAQDGYDGPGFRLRGTTGQPHLSYLNPEQFKFSAVPSTGEPFATILDPNGHPYLYFPGNKSVNPSVSYVADFIPPPVWPTPPPQQPMYNYHDNRDAFAPDTNYALGLQRMQRMLGDTNMDGMIGPGENARWTGPFVLWGAGPDEMFGPLDPTDSNQVTKCDDVTNVP